MKKIGIISDTHAWWDDKFAIYFNDCDEIWHAGDIGNEDIAYRLNTLAPLRAVYGNIDGSVIRRKYNELEIFETEGVKVVMTHIGGYPGKYAPGIKKVLLEEKPHIFISGHSHILKVMGDSQLGLLHINPGAAGKQGWQVVRTLVILYIDNGTIKDCEVIELSK